MGGGRNWAVAAAEASVSWLKEKWRKPKPPAATTQATDLERGLGNEGGAPDNENLGRAAVPEAPPRSSGGSRVQDSVGGAGI